MNWKFPYTQNHLPKSKYGKIYKIRSIKKLSAQSSSVRLLLNSNKKNKNLNNMKKIGELCSQKDLFENYIFSYQEPEKYDNEIIKGILWKVHCSIFRDKFHFELKCNFTNKIWLNYCEEIYNQTYNVKFLKT